MLSYISSWAEFRILGVVLYYLFYPIVDFAHPENIRSIRYLFLGDYFLSVIVIHISPLTQQHLVDISFFIKFTVKWQSTVTGVFFLNTKHLYHWPFPLYPFLLPMSPGVDTRTVECGALHSPGHNAQLCCSYTSVHLEGTVYELFMTLSISKTGLSSCIAWTSDL